MSNAKQKKTAREESRDEDLAHQDDQEGAVDETDDGPESAPTPLSFAPALTAVLWKASTCFRSEA